MITDWFTDDDLSDEEKDQQKEENLSVVDDARQRQDRVCLAAARTAMKVSNSAIWTQIFNPFVGSNAICASTHLGKDKTVWKNSPTLVVGRTPAHYVYTGASGVPRQVLQSIPHLMMHESTSFLKLFFAL